MQNLRIDLRIRPHWIVVWACLGIWVLPPTAFSQESKAKGSGEQEAVFSDGELEQLVAPIALYPDALVAQILMASTYPLEIVQARRWMLDNESLEGDALTEALEKQPWDPSVKSLVNFPTVLGHMSDKLDWTQKLGDAVLAQQGDVMESVQTLRQKAVEAGHLETNEQQKVVVEKETIIIESAEPEVIYVPTYNPTVVYGVWAYPAYPPRYYYPPGYVYPRRGVSFAAGFAAGAAWGYAWGGCRWGRNDIDIDVNRNVNVNRNIDRNRYNQRARNNTWQHNANHRKGVRYRDNQTAQRYKGRSNTNRRSRDAYRGRKSTAQQRSRSSQTQNRNRANTSSRSQRGNRTSAKRTNSNQTRKKSSSGRSKSAFKTGGSKSRTRQSASRGRSSRGGRRR